ncbi:MAG: hypothetical protein ABII89_01865 [Candidatus Omnitrophota bacterium]
MKNKKWPVPAIEDERFKGEGIKRFLKMRAEYEKSAFVSEGHLEVRRLGPVAFAEVIPPEECAVTSLVRYSSGKIYGGTSGRKAHLFYYDPSPDADVVVDAGVVGENTGITSLVTEETGKIFGATDGKNGGFLFSYSPCEVLLDKLTLKGKGLREIFDAPAEDQVFHSIVDPCHSAGKVDTLLKPFKHEGISSLAIDNNRKILYGLSSKNGLFFTYEIEKKKITVKEKIDEINEFSRKLLIVKNGIVYGLGYKGQIVKFDPKKSKLERLDIFAPSLKGRELYNRVDCWVFDEESGLIYGGTIDGIIFIFNPENEEIICLGKPIDQMRIRALTVGKDGRVFGVGGEPGKCCHLFVYEPRKRQLRDLGVLLATHETPWCGYEIDSAVTGKDGEIYLGESDRISHLFIYFPQIERRNACQKSE